MAQSKINNTAFYVFIQVFLLAAVAGFSTDLKYLEFFSYIVPITILAISSRIQQRFFSLYNIFIIVLSIFHFGEFWLDFFNVPVDTSNGHDIFAIYDTHNVLHSLSFSLYSILILNIGASIILKNADQKDLEPIVGKKHTVAKIIFLLLIPLMLYNDFDRIVLTQTFSYSEAVYMTTFLSRFETSFMVAALILLTRHDKFSKFTFIYMALRAVVLMVFTGSRIGAILELILMFYAYFKDIKVSYKRLAGLGIVAYVALVLIGYVKATRGFLSISLSEYLAEGGIFSSQLSEFGSTMETLTLAITHDSLVGGLNGLTYLSAILTIIPFSTRLFPFIVKYRVAHDFLNPYAPSIGALGGSFFAEQYMNFGDSGMLLSLLFGVLFAKMQNVISAENDPFRSVLFISLYYGVLIYSRANMYDFIANLCGIIYFLVLYWMLGKIVKR